MNFYRENRITFLFILGLVILLQQVDSFAYSSEEDGLEDNVEYRQDEIDKSNREVLTAEYYLKLARQKVRVNKSKKKVAVNQLENVKNGHYSFVVNFYDRTKAKKFYSQRNWVDSVCRIDSRIPLNEINQYYSNLANSYSDLFSKSGVMNERNLVINELYALRAEVMQLIDYSIRHHETKYTNVIEKDINFKAYLYDSDSEWICVINTELLLTHNQN